MGGDPGSMGRPGAKQSQDADKDAAAAEIQGAAASFLKAKKVEAERDAAAAEIQGSAAAFLARKRSEKEVTDKVGPLVPIKLDEVAKNVADGFAELSHRIFGGDKKEESGATAARGGKWERPESAAKVEASDEMQYDTVVPST